MGRQGVPAGGKNAYLSSVKMTKVRKCAHCKRAVEEFHNEYYIKLKEVIKPPKKSRSKVFFCSYRCTKEWLSAKSED